MSQVQIEVADFIFQIVETIIPACVVLSVSLLLVKVFKRFING